MTDLLKFENKEKLFKWFMGNFKLTVLNTNGKSEYAWVAQFELSNIYEAFLDSLDNILTEQNKGETK
jgi:hypothetical protein